MIELLTGLKAGKNFGEILAKPIMSNESGTAFQSVFEASAGNSSKHSLVTAQDAESNRESVDSSGHSENETELGAIRVSDETMADIEPTIDALEDQDSYQLTRVPIHRFDNSAEKKSAPVDPWAGTMKKPRNTDEVARASPVSKTEPTVNHLVVGKRGEVGFSLPALHPEAKLMGVANRLQETEAEPAKSQEQQTAPVTKPETTESTRLTDLTDASLVRPQLNAQVTNVADREEGSPGPAELIAPDEFNVPIGAQVKVDWAIPTTGQMFVQTPVETVQKELVSGFFDADLPSNNVPRKQNPATPKSVLLKFDKPQDNMIPTSKVSDLEFKYQAGDEKHPGFSKTTTVGNVTRQGVLVHDLKPVDTLGKSVIPTTHSSAYQGELRVEEPRSDAPKKLEAERVVSTVPAHSGVTDNRGSSFASAQVTPLFFKEQTNSYVMPDADTLEVTNAAHERHAGRAYASDTGGVSSGTVARGLDRSTIIHVVQSSAAPGRGTVEISLEPETLGRVRITLTQVEGSLVVTLAADRQDTIDLMRRHSTELTQQYREIGYDAIELKFSGMSDQGSDRGGSHGKDGKQSETDQTNLQMSLERGVTLSQGLDIRV